MPYKINHLADQAVIELSLTGVVTGDELRASTSKCIAMQRDLGIKCFIVHADSSEIFATLFDLHDLAENQYHREGLDRGTRIAVVLPSSTSAREAADFYETVCRNRGWNTQIHPDPQSALEWLAES